MANKFKKKIGSQATFVIFGIQNLLSKGDLVTTVNNSNKIYGSNMKKMKFLDERISVMVTSSHHPVPYKKGCSSTSSYIKVFLFYVHYIQIAIVLHVTLQYSQVLNILASFKNSPGFISNTYQSS